MSKKCLKKYSRLAKPKKVKKRRAKPVLHQEKKKNRATRRSTPKKEKKKVENRSASPAPIKEKKRGVVQSLMHLFLPPLFSPQIEQIEFWQVRRENTWASPIFHPPLLSNQTPIKSIFAPLFSPLFSIFPVSPQPNELLKL